MLKLSRERKRVSLPGPSWLPFAAVISLLAVAFSPVAFNYTQRYAIPLHAAAAIYCSFLLLLVLALMPGIRGARELAQKWLNTRRAWVLIPIWCLPYLVYSTGTGNFRWSALFRILTAAVPVLSIYQLVSVRDSAKFSWQDALAAILLITAVLSHTLTAVWNIPANLDFMTRLLLISIASWCWVFIRPTPELGYDLRVSRKIFKAAAINFVLFAIIAIPSSLTMHFTAWHPRWKGVPAFCINYLEIFLFVALLEELFFRGFLQTLVSNSLHSPITGQVIVSCLFGFFHILHAPFPNWRYVALASVAGWFYGSAFRSAGNNITAPTLMHAMVDTVWRTWLSRS
jgi:uncharacterized protein